MSEILDLEALKKLTKDDIIKYALKVSGIGSQVESLSKKFDELHLRLEKSESEVAIIKNVNTRLLERIETLEGKILANERVNVNNSQYLRNRQIEIKKVPSNIEADNLRSKMAELLSLTGLMRHVARSRLTSHFLA